MRIAFGDYVQNTESEKKAANIAYSKTWPDLLPGNEVGPVALCAAGPSLLSQLPTLKKMSDDNIPICAVKGVENVLRDHGINVRYCVYMDAKADQLRFIKNPSRGTLYLLASQCDPSVFDALNGYDIRVFHMTNPSLHNGGEMFILGGMTTGLRSINLMRTLGYSVIHLFGYDCCLSDDQSHVYDKEKIGDKFRVYVGGVPFWTTGELAIQHEQFLNQYVYTPGAPAFAVHGFSALFQSMKELTSPTPNRGNMDMDIRPEDAPKGGKILTTPEEVEKFINHPDMQYVRVA
jgi:Protein of unknown function DUF115